MKKIFGLALAFISAWLATASAQSSTYSQIVAADTFVSSGQSNVNFGTMGGMEIAAPSSAQPRLQIALLRFDAAALQAAFDSDFGASNWMVTSVTLTLASSVATAGQQPNNASFNKIAAGSFEFALLSNNNWIEDGITWNSLPSILPGNNGNTLTPLGTFFWDATGRPITMWTLNPLPALTQKIQNGELMTFLGQPSAGSSVGYLFNTRTTFNVPTLSITAEAVPEPSLTALIISLLCVTTAKRFSREN